MRPDSHATVCSVDLVDEEVNNLEHN